MLRFLLLSVLLLSGCFQNRNQIKVMLLEGQSLHHDNWSEIGDSVEALFSSSAKFALTRVTSPAINQDLAQFTPDFDKFDVIVSTYDGSRWSDAAEKAFLDFISHGGGLVTIHAADNAFGDWKEYNAMIGIGGWGGRDSTSGPYLFLDRHGRVARDSSAGPAGYHGDAHSFSIRKRSAHVITSVLPDVWDHPVDELYEQLRGPGTNLQVLASAYADPEFSGGGREEPVCMAINYRQGRICHLTLGHNPQVFANREFRLLLTRGTEWAASGTATD